MKAYFWDVLPKSGIAPELGKGKFVVAFVGSVVQGALLAERFPNAEVTEAAGIVRIVAHDRDYSQVINFVEQLGGEWQEGKI